MLVTDRAGSLLYLGYISKQCHSFFNKETTYINHRLERGPQTLQQTINILIWKAVENLQYTLMLASLQLKTSLREASGYQQCPCPRSENIPAVTASQQAHLRHCRPVQGCDTAWYLQPGLAGSRLPTGNFSVVYFPCLLSPSSQFLT